MGVQVGANPINFLGFPPDAGRVEVAGQTVWPTGGPAPSWSPIEMFSGGVPGAWYDPSDLSTLFQDTGGTTPVTATGQPVGLMLDKSGNGNHIAQAASVSRPTYQTDGTLHWLEFDGANDFMGAPSVDMSATDKLTAMVGVAMNNGPTVVFFELSESNNGADGTFWIGRTSADSYRTISRGDARISASQGASTPANFPPSTHSVIATTHDISGDLSRIRADGGPAWSQGTGDKGGGNFRNDSLFLGMRAGNSFPLDGKIFGVVLVGKLSTDAEISDAEAYLAIKTGT